MAKCKVDWRYGEATITWVLPEVAELDDDRLEYSMVHELQHIFVNELRETEGWIDHEERVCTTLAKAFVWLRDHIREECSAGKKAEPLICAGSAPEPSGGS